MTRITFRHHVRGFESSVGDFGDRELFVVGLFSGDDRGVRGHDEVDTGVGDQVGLEFGDIDVKGTIETERSGQGGDDLSDQTVEVGVGGAFNVEGTTADIVDGFVVEHDGDISVFEEGVGGEDGVVGFDDSSRDLGRGVDGEAELGLLTVVDGETFEEEGTETRASTTTDGVEDQETLETSAVIGELADTVEGEIDEFLTNGVVTTSVVVSGIFLTSDQLFRVEELTVGTSADFIDDGGFEIDEDSAGDVLTSTSFREKGVEGIITTTDGLIRGHLTIRLDTVFETEEFPAGVTDLDTGLTQVNGNDFTHCSSC